MKLRGLLAVLVLASQVAAAAPSHPRKKAATTAVATAKRGAHGHKPAPAPAPVSPSHARVVIGGGSRDTALVDDSWRREKDSELTLEERTAKRIEDLLRTGPLRAGTTALYVVDATTGAELFAVHPDDPLNPASNVKLISTATALEALGADYRYQTRVLGPTPEPDGTVHGDVYLLGSYDPTLDVAGVRDLAAGLRARGVTSIDGGLVVGADGDRDGVFRASVRITVAATAPGKTPTVSIEPLTSFAIVTNEVTTAKGRRSAIKVADSSATDAHGRARLAVHLTGTIGRGKSATYTVWPDDASRGAFTAELLRAALTKEGITVSGEVRTAELGDYATDAGKHGWLPVELATHQSAPLASIVAQVNKRSINWLADRIVMTAAAAKYGQAPSMSRAIDAMYAWLDGRAHLARKDLLIDTGSGLSHRTNFSARQVVDVLRAAAGLDPSVPADPRLEACHAAYLESLSVAGVDGTLRGRFRGALRGKLHAKTGTLNQAVALSGFLDAAPGHALAFSLITNGNAPGSHRDVRAAHEKLVGILADYATALAKKDPQPAAPAIVPPPTPAPSVPASTPLPADDDEGEEGGDEPAAAAIPGSGLQAPGSGP